MALTLDCFKELVNRFQAKLDALRDEHPFPGATAAFVLPDGEYYGFATGLADREDNTPMTPYTRMLSGSVGKSFVGAVAVSLAMDGKLNLDDKISNWLGDESWFSRLPNGPDITMRMLLTHSSGLIDHVYDERYQEAVVQLVTSPDFDPDTAFSYRALVEFVLDTDPLFPAGEKHAYTNTGYVLAGLVINKVTGSTYYEELRKRFLDPLYLSLTDPSDKRDLPGLCPGYIPENDPSGLPLPSKVVKDGLMIFNPAMEWTGGGLVTNPKDLVLWAKALFEGCAMSGDYLPELLKSVPMDESGESRCGGRACSSCRRRVARFTRTVDGSPAISPRWLTSKTIKWPSPCR